MMRYRGLLYRALNPIRAREPLSGEGARLHGGRFNPKGMPALYTSLSVMTALREANRIGSLQPMTLVSYAADIGPVFDAGDAAALAARGMSAEALAADDWRLAMQKTGLVPTQAFAARLMQEGFAGLRVRSYAPGATEGSLNLVLWRWSGEPPAQLLLIDDEGRLA